jgi:DNA polymerase III delta subunit
VSAVEDLVGVRHGETLGDLLDAISVRDADKALRLLGHVLSQPRTTGVSVLLSLTTQTLALAYARALVDEGASASRLYDPLMEFLKSGKGVMTGRPWGEAVQSWVRAAGSWTSSELAAACETLLRADISLKDTRASSDEQVLATVILELCARRKSVPSKR